MMAKNILENTKHSWKNKHSQNEKKKEIVRLFILVGVVRTNCSKLYALT